MTARELVCTNRTEMERAAAQEGGTETKGRETPQQTMGKENTVSMHIASTTTTGDGWDYNQDQPDLLGA